MQLNEEFDVKIRELTRKDRKTLTKLIQKFAKIKESPQLISMVPNISKEQNDEELQEKGENFLSNILEFAFTLLEDMLKVIEEDITEWFLELSNLTQDEYDNGPFDIEIQIIQQIVTGKKFKDFFLRGSLVLKSIKVLAGQLRS